MLGTVMLIDDEEKVASLVQATFSTDERFRLVVCRHAEEALKIARREKPDLVLVDVLMPKRDGYQVCRALKSDPATAHAKVLMLTALAQDTDRQKAADAGADGYLTKPFSPIGLLSLAEETLASKGR